MLVEEYCVFLDEGFGVWKIFVCADCDVDGVLDWIATVETSVVQSF